MEKIVTMKPETVTRVTMNQNEFDNIIMMAAGEEMKEIINITLHEGNIEIAKLLTEILSEYTANLISGCHKIILQKKEEK